MFCTNCGAKLTDGSNFCTVCGTKVMWPAAPDPQPETVAPAVPTEDPIPSDMEIREAELQETVDLPEAEISSPVEEVHKEPHVSTPAEEPSVAEEPESAESFTEIPEMEEPVTEEPEIHVSEEPAAWDYTPEPIPEIVPEPVPEESTEPEAAPASDPSVSEPTTVFTPAPSAAAVYEPAPAAPVYTPPISATAPYIPAIAKRMVPISAYVFLGISLLLNALNFLYLPMYSAEYSLIFSAVISLVTLTGYFVTKKTKWVTLVGFILFAVHQLLFGTFLSFFFAGAWDYINYGVFGSISSILNSFLPVLVYIFLFIAVLCCGVSGNKFWKTLSIVLFGWIFMSWFDSAVSFVMDPGSFLGIFLNSSVLAAYSISALIWLGSDADKK